MQSRDAILTQAQIDASAPRGFLSLYYELWEQGIIDHEEVPNSWRAYRQATQTLHATIPDTTPEAHSAHLSLESAGSDLPQTTFKEGFKRGIALVVWLHAIAEQDKPADARQAPALTPTEWYVSGKVSDAALEQ
jgi:hypothetical protein